MGWRPAERPARTRNLGPLRSVGACGSPPRRSHDRKVRTPPRRGCRHPACLSGLIEAQIGGAGPGGASKTPRDPTAGFSVGSLDCGGQPVTLLTSGIYEGFLTDGVIGYALLGHYAVELVERDGNAFPVPAAAERRLIGRGLSGDIFGKETRLSRAAVGPFTLEDIPAMVTPTSGSARPLHADGCAGPSAANGPRRDPRSVSPVTPVRYP